MDALNHRGTRSPLRAQGRPHAGTQEGGGMDVVGRASAHFWGRIHHAQRGGGRGRRETHGKEQAMLVWKRTGDRRCVNFIIISLF